MTHNYIIHDYENNLITSYGIVKIEQAKKNQKKNLRAVA